MIVLQLYVALVFLIGVITGYLIAKGPDYLFIDNWKKLNERFLLDNEDIIGLTLNDHVDGLQVSNIIDLYLYYLEYYFTI